MITSEIFESTLIKPIKHGANRLLVVSGYASASMVFHHFKSARVLDKNLNVDLILGMCAKDGLSMVNHRGFVKLMQEEFFGKFTCRYVIAPPPVHSKTYAWFEDDSPIVGFAGSANYTQTAFLFTQREVLTECNASECRSYFAEIYKDAVLCDDEDVHQYVNIYKSDTKIPKEKEVFPAPEPEVIDPEIKKLPHITTSFLDRSGNLPQKSGLNWGQRDNREPNQAYIRLPKEIYRSDFFPGEGVHFTVLTDDDQILYCTRA